MIARAVYGPCLGVVSAGGERLIDLRHDFCGPVAIGSYYNSIGMKEVGHGCSFTKEFGVGDNIEHLA